VNKVRSSQQPRQTNTSAAASRRQSVFERNPKKTLTAVIVLAFFIVDLLITNALVFSGLYSPPHKTEARYRTQHPVYHHTLKSNIDNVDAQFGPVQHSVSTNSLGFKDRAPRDVRLKAESARLVIIGDSFTEGVGVDYADTFAGIIDQQLSLGGIEVLNAGVSSYSPIIYRRKIEYLIEQGLTFDRLLVLIDMSDIQNEQKHYRFDDDLNVVDRNPDGVGDAVREWLTDNTIFYASMRLWMRQMKRRGKADKVEQQGGMAINQDRARWTVDDNLYERWGKQGLEISAEHMDALYRLSIETGFELSVAVYPWPDQIWQRDLESRQVSFWQAWSESHDVTFIDLFPLFINEGEAAETVIQRLFIAGDVHWNKAGHAEVARALLNHPGLQDAQWHRTAGAAE